MPKKNAQRKEHQLQPLWPDLQLCKLEPLSLDAM